MRSPVFFPVAFLLAAALAAQTPVTTGFVRGILVDVDGGASSASQFSIRSGAVVYRFGFDSKTWIEKQEQRIQSAGLTLGDILEVVCDRDATPVRYARMVHVVENPKPRPPVQSGLYRLRHSPVEFIAPRGNLTYSGIVASLTDEHLVLRTRFDGEKIVYRRKDTSYLEGGFQVEPGMLKANTRVFLRAGRNPDDEIEAYQVIWGEIFDPNAPK